MGTARYGLLSALLACGVGTPGAGGLDDGIDLAPPPGSDSGGDPGGDDDAAADDTPAPARAAVRRLTRFQYANAVRDLLGPDIAIPDALDPDLVEALYANVGAASAVTSQLGADQFDAAARDIASQAFAGAGQTLVACDPGAPGCAASFARAFGRRAFRRELDGDEVERYVALADELTAIRGDPEAGLEGILAAMLASPSFLYIGELGEADPDAEDRLRFTSTEMASRLSFAIWASIPDETLLADGIDGTLTSPAEIRAAAARLIADPRARRGLGRFLAEWLGLDVVDALGKDTDVFPDASPELFASMHGELRRLAEGIAFDPDRSLLDLLDAPETYVDARLAAHYGIDAPAELDDDGFGLVVGDGKRVGLLGTAAVLASQSRRTRTSPTLRGLYVQRRLLCRELGPPPADVEMELPPDGGAATLREQLEQHRKNPVCASCHALVDPIGLALERFDAVGAYRAEDGGTPIDATAELEGERIDGLVELAAVLRDDPALAECMVRQLYRYTTGHVEDAAEDPAIEALTEAFAARDFNLVRFLPHLFASTSFRTLAGGKA